MKFGKLLAVLVSIQLFSTSNATAQTLSFSPEGLQQFGWDNVGKRIELYAYLNNVYDCKSPSIRGQICAEMDYKGRFFYDAVFIPEFESVDFAPIIKKCVFMYGNIEMMNVVINGIATNIPQLLVERIKPTAGTYC
ncbi:hypothetical protein N9X08_09175 [Planktomarina temperata]|nr:hypothetical protein [Planktomarina temperata]